MFFCSEKWFQIEEHIFFREVETTTYLVVHRTPSKLGCNPLGVIINQLTRADCNWQPNLQLVTSQHEPPSKVSVGIPSRDTLRNGSLAFDLWLCEFRHVWVLTCWRRIDGQDGRFLVISMGNRIRACGGFKPFSRQTLLSLRERLGKTAPRVYLLNLDAWEPPPASWRLWLMARPNVSGVIWGQFFRISEAKLHPEFLIVSRKFSNILLEHTPNLNQHYKDFFHLGVKGDVWGMRNRSTFCGSLGDDQLGERTATCFHSPIGFVIRDTYAFVVLRLLNINPIYGFLFQEVCSFNGGMTVPRLLAGNFDPNSYQEAKVTKGVKWFYQFPTRWFNVTFRSLSWRSSNLWMGHLIIPKSSQKNARKPIFFKMCPFGGSRFDGPFLFRELLGQPNVWRCISYQK